MLAVIAYSVHAVEWKSGDGNAVNAEAGPKVSGGAGEGTVPLPVPVPVLGRRLATPRMTEEARPCEVLLKATPEDKWTPVEVGTITLFTSDGRASLDVEEGALPNAADCRDLQGATLSTATITSAASAWVVGETSVKLYFWGFEGTLVRAEEAVAMKPILHCQTGGSPAWGLAPSHPGVTTENVDVHSGSLPLYIAAGSELESTHWARVEGGAWSRVTSRARIDGTQEYVLKAAGAASLSVRLSGGEHLRSHPRLVVMAQSGGMALNAKLNIGTVNEYGGLIPGQVQLHVGFGSTQNVVSKPIKTSGVLLLAGEIHGMNVVLVDDLGVQARVTVDVTFSGMGMLQGRVDPGAWVVRIESNDGYLHAAPSSRLVAGLVDEGGILAQCTSVSLGPLAVGRYEVRLSPLDIRQEFDLTDGGGRVDLVVPIMSRVVVSAIDEDGAKLKLNSLSASWRDDGGQLRKANSAREDDHVWDVLCPPGELVLRARSEDDQYKVETVQVLAGWNAHAIVLGGDVVHKITTVHDGGPFGVPINWWMKSDVQRVSGSGQFIRRLISFDLGPDGLAAGGVAEAKFLFSGPGEFIIVPPDVATLVGPMEILISVGGATGATEVEVELK